MGEEQSTGSSGWFTPMASAAAVAAVVMAGAGLSQLDLDTSRSDLSRPVGPEEGRGEVTRASNGRVADLFTCPARIPYDFGSGESALQGAALDGPRAFADEMGAARFELAGSPDATVLRLGNADGSLASLNTMHRADWGWVLDDMTACYGRDNMLVPVPGHGELGVHGAEPRPVEDVIGEQPDAVLVDDRGYYNAAGVIHQRSLYAFPCGEDVCFAAADGTSLHTEPVRGDGAPEDLTRLFLPDEPLQDRPPPYSFLAVYDPDDAITRVAWESSGGGRLQWVEPMEPTGWTGRLFLVLAKHDPDGSVLVYPQDGGVRTYDARGYALP